MKEAGMIDKTMQNWLTNSRQLPVRNCRQPDQARGFIRTISEKRLLDNMPGCRNLRLGLISEKQKDPEANASATRLATISVITIVISIVLVSLIAFVIARGITRPIKLMSDTARRLALGDIDQTLDYESKDEYGVLVMPFDR